MMPNRSRAMHSIRPDFLEGVQLKIWGRESLRREDWDFSGLKDFPAEHLRLAWHYEADRELGCGNLPFLLAWEAHEKEKRKAKLKAHVNGTHRLSLEELLELVPMPPENSEIEAAAELTKMLGNPDMSVAETERYWEKDRALWRIKSHRLNKLLVAEVLSTDTKWKPPIPKEPEPMLKSYDHHEFCEMKVLAMPGYRWVDGNSSHHCTIHPLEIDWTLTASELVEAFRNWLRKGEHYPFHPSYKRMAMDSKVGKRKRDSWIAWLRELAIYRIGEAGISRAEGLRMLKSFLKEISASNWEHAQARTRKRIKEEKQRCESFAWDQGRGSPKNWRDYFVTPFGRGGL